MKYIIATLGCKVNQYETQAMESILTSRGHSAAQKGQTADAVIINSCAVTAESGRKSRQTMRRLVHDNPGAVLAVCGCYSQLEPDECAALGAKVIFGAAHRRDFVDAVEKAVAEDRETRLIDEPFKRRVIEELPAGAVSGRTRAMLKIQDGCVNFCTYCIIPYTRGRLRSLPVEKAVEETIRLRDEGFRELVLTGIEIASYGVDLAEKPDLADVICACAQVSGDMRIRLGSLEPTVITEDFCRKLAYTDKLCRHFHLSLQSGCDSTLRRMNRKYDTARFFEAVELLRKHFPGCALTCDLITGFPGESEEEHRSTLEFIRRCAFADMHVFPYSRRPGTPADSMEGQLSRAVKEARAAEASQLGRKMRQDFMLGSVGQKLSVLFETEENGISTGHSDTYLPVSVKGHNLRGKCLELIIRSYENAQLWAEMV